MPCIHAFVEKDNFDKYLVYERILKNRRRGQIVAQGNFNWADANLVDNDDDDDDDDDEEKDK